VSNSSQANRQVLTLFLADPWSKEWGQPHTTVSCFSGMRVCGLYLPSKSNHDMIAARLAEAERLAAGR